ncbi:4-hydroxy-tetrahydrodipicolinate synthase [Candidatus Poribacteria bacterium]|nr:4-hydroxy-tetrahydrodipicolinate synthase [Candidatus Poribacteria bacterium]
MFRGSIVAIVTPFREDESLDIPQLKKLVEFHIEHGTHGIVPCGTTGESPTLSHEEHETVVEETIRAVDGRVPVIAGSGSNSTAEALRLTRHAKAAGADGALVITPYYNRPTQDGLIRHFTKIADAVEIPMIIYNVPGRTGTDILPETLAKLSAHPNIVGVKEATGSLKRTSEVVAACGEDFTVLSGDDIVTLPMMSVGAKGTITVVANIAPGQVAEMCDAFDAGDLARARQLHYDVMPLSIDLFIETNPIPVKTAMQMMGLLNGVMRLPLCPMGAANAEKLRASLKACGLLS